MIRILICSLALETQKFGILIHSRVLCLINTGLVSTRHSTTVTCNIDHDVISVLVRYGGGGVLNLVWTVVCGNIGPFACAKMDQCLGIYFVENGTHVSGFLVKN